MYITIHESFLSHKKYFLQEAEKSKQSTKEKFETIQRQYKQQEEYWNKEKSQRLQHLEVCIASSSLLPFETD